MFINDDFICEPSRCGACPIGRFTIGLGYDFTDFVDKVDEDAVADGGFVVGLPDEREGLGC